MTTNEQIQHLEALVTLQRMVKAQQEEIENLTKHLVDQGRKCLWLLIHNELCMKHLLDQDLRQEIKAKAHAETERLEVIENLRMDYESDSFERQEGAES